MPHNTDIDLCDKCEQETKNLFMHVRTSYDCHDIIYDKAGVYKGSPCIKKWTLGEFFEQHEGEDQQDGSIIMRVNAISPASSSTHNKMSIKALISSEKQNGEEVEETVQIDATGKFRLHPYVCPEINIPKTSSKILRFAALHSVTFSFIANLTGLNSLFCPSIKIDETFLIFKNDGAPYTIEQSCHYKGRDNKIMIHTLDGLKLSNFLDNQQKSSSDYFYDVSKRRMFEFSPSRPPIKLLEDEAMSGTVTIATKPNSNPASDDVAIIKMFENSMVPSECAIKDKG